MFLLLPCLALSSSSQKVSYFLPALALVSSEFIYARITMKDYIISYLISLILPEI